MNTIRSGGPSMWTTLYPRRRGLWTAVSTDGQPATFDPEDRHYTVVDPRRDGALPGITEALRRGSLVSYRVGRRAVVRTPRSFIKVVRPKRWADVVCRHEMMSGVACNIETPTVLSAADDGRIELSGLSGRSLHQVLRQDDEAHIAATIELVADRLAELHQTQPPDWLGTRPPDNPHTWVDTVARVLPAVAPVLRATADALPALVAPPVGGAVVHGDLHDKNVFVDRSIVGVIDLDGLATGAAEDDVANLAVHLELRAMQAGKCDRLGRLRAELLRDSYRQHRNLQAERWQAVVSHTWFRLSCLYRFRAGSVHLADEMLRRARRDER